MKLLKNLVLLACFFFLTSVPAYAVPAEAPATRALSSDDALLESMSQTQLSRRIDKLDRDLANLTRKLGRLEDRVERYH
jgi:hypothetical protein